jgi:hypothetical protein
MKANDLAWKDGMTQAEYDQRTHMNKLDLILIVHRGRVEGACVLANDDIAQDEEVGITYGFDYWNC